MRLFKAILPLIFSLSWLQGIAQVFPVQATTQLRPPYSLFLSDYAAPGSERLALNVFLVDAGRPELNVRFRLRIEGQGIRIETKPEFLPLPTSLTGGVPLQLISADLAPYFESRNLNFTGISQREYEQRGALPEGLYQFCFEVLEYNRGVKISNTSCAAAWLILNDPPIVNLPRDGEKVRIQEPQQVIFQWTPRHTGSPNSAFSTEYDFKMVEIWPPTRNPNDAILTSPPVFETTTNATTLIYGPAETPLEPGRRYAIQLKARSVTGVEELNLFKNNGLSQVYTFQYGDACNAPTNIVGEAPGPSRIALRWNGGLNETAYKVRYRPASSDNSVWYTDNIFFTDHEIKSLQPNTRYEYQIASTCGTFESTWSTVASITTPDVEGIAYSCGLPMAPFNLDPSQLIDVIKVGDVIRAGDFDVKISKVTGSAGTFSGEGVIEVSYFNKAKVKAEFTNIVVNKELRMVNGFMNVTGAGVEIIPAGVMDFMDKLDETLAQVDSLLNEYEANLPQQFDPGSFVADTAIRVNGTIASVTKDESGNVVIVDASGTRTTVPAGTSAAITDSAGNGYLVDKKGNIHKTSADVAAKAGNREYNLALKFDASPNQAFGFDVKHDPLAVKYERLEGDKYASWKSVATGRTDAVLAILEGTGFDKSKIRFEQAGSPLTPNTSAPNSSTANAYELRVNGTSDGIEEGLLALYTPPDTTQKEQVLGKLNVATYDEIQKTVVIVPVNGNKYPYSEANLRTQLNKIYGQAVVKWNVQMAPEGFVVPGIDPFDDGGSGLLSNYSPDMRKVVDAYNTDPAPDTYYLFLVKNPKAGKLAGYMPRSKEFGFIFTDQAGSEQAIIHTIAHELGHGAFNLRHTFAEEKYTIPQGSTDNLMDYTQAFGTKLFKHQWDQMRYPEIVVGLFEGDKDQMALAPLRIAETSEEAFDFDFNGENLPEVLCFTPSGKLYAVLAEEEMSFENSTQIPVPKGALVSYKFLGEWYFANYTKKDDSWYFEGYFTKGGKPGYSRWSVERVEAELSKEEQNINIVGSNMAAGLIIMPIPANEIEIFLLRLGTKSGAVVKNIGNTTKAIGIALVLSGILELFTVTSTIERGNGIVVPSLPISDLVLATERSYVRNPPQSISIAVPHAISNEKGLCHVYVIWGNRIDGTQFIAKYGMTCQEDYLSDFECNPRPDLQCTKFTRDNTDPTILDYKYSWIKRDVSRAIALVIERSMTASYVITHGGRLPPKHYLPCFVRKDDFDERIDRATQHINEQIQKFGK